MPHKAGAFKEKWGLYSLCQGAEVSLGVHGGRDVFHQKLTLLRSRLCILFRLPRGGPTAYPSTNR